MTHRRKPKKNPHAAALGKLGRAVNSEAQKAAARVNGKKGGRPKKDRGECPYCRKPIRAGEETYECGADTEEKWHEHVKCADKADARS